MSEFATALRTIAAVLPHSCLKPLADLGLVVKDEVALAEPLRVGAGAARAIGSARQQDKTEIDEQASRAEKIAEALEKIVDGAADRSPIQ